MLEQLQQIVELSVDVSADCDGGVDSLDIALLDEDLSGFEAQLLDLLLRNSLAALKLLNLLIEFRHDLKYYSQFTVSAISSLKNTQSYLVPGSIPLVVGVIAILDMRMGAGAAGVFQEYV